MSSHGYCWEPGNLGEIPGAHYLWCECIRSALLITLTGIACGPIVYVLPMRHLPVPTGASTQLECYAAPREQATLPPVEEHRVRCNDLAARQPTPPCLA